MEKENVGMAKLVDAHQVLFVSVVQFHNIDY